MVSCIRDGHDRLVHNAQAKALEGQVPTLAQARRMNDAELVEHFTQVRGIGQ